MSENIRSATTAAPREEVVLERRYRATVQELWDLWTTKEGFESWWAPEGARTRVHVIEARPDGELRYDMIAETPKLIAAMQEQGLPTSHVERARFSVFQPLERLVLRLMIDFVPGIEPYESTIVVDFSASGEWACMVVTLMPMHDEAFTLMAKRGLASQLENIDELLRRRGQ
jgi:uncharacterized protein YndB with AHSA1/START domain